MSDAAYLETGLAFWMTWIIGITLATLIVRWIYKLERRISKLESKDAPK